MTNSTAKPSLWWLISEPARAILELGLSVPYKKYLDVNKTSDGHPVFVIPGFLSTEKSTLYLRQFLSKKGYNVYDWGLGRNLGKIKDLDILLERIDEIYESTGKPISLIGWSLGGIFARQIGKQRTTKVRQVITLGSPFSGITEPNNIAWAYRFLNKGKKVEHIDPEFLENVPLPAQVPTTAVYTKEDGVVSWKHCIEKHESKFHQNVQVHGSHIGLGVNPSVLSIISDRLMYKKSNWKKFVAIGLINKKIIYPSI